MINIFFYEWRKQKLTVVGACSYIPFLAASCLSACWVMKHYKKWVWQWMQMTAERQTRNGEVTNWKGARDGVNGGMIDVTLMLGEERGGEKRGGRHKPILTFFRVCHFAFVSDGGPLIITHYYPFLPPSPLSVTLTVPVRPQPDIMVHCEDESGAPTKRVAKILKEIHFQHFAFFFFFLRSARDRKRLAESGHGTGEGRWRQR